MCVGYSHRYFKNHFESIFLGWRRRFIEGNKLSNIGNEALDQESGSFLDQLIVQTEVRKP